MLQRSIKFARFLSYGDILKRIAYICDLLETIEVRSKDSIVATAVRRSKSSAKIVTTFTRRFASADLLLCSLHRSIDERGTSGRFGNRRRIAESALLDSSTTA